MPSIDVVFADCGEQRLVAGASFLKRHCERPCERAGDRFRITGIDAIIMAYSLFTLRRKRYGVETTPAARQLGLTQAVKFALSQIVLIVARHRRVPVQGSSHSRACAAGSF